MANETDDSGGVVDHLSRCSGFALTFLRCGGKASIDAVVTFF